MNIFVTDPSPRTCAEALDDKRVIKMCLETAQILSTALRTLDIKHMDLPKLYQPTHRHHPCVKWASSSLNNMYWLRDHLGYLLDEYTARFNKTHASHVIFEIVSDIRPGRFIPGAINFVNCARNLSLGLDFTQYPVCDAYRLYLRARWDSDVRKPKWSTRAPPSWYDNQVHV